MWIIPKNLSIYHYAQDTEALILDSQELSGQLEQSVMWRSKPSQSKTWYRRLKKDCSLQLLFSQTLKSSIGSSLVEKWTYSQEASLVSHLATQEESKEIKTLDTCGHTSQKELNIWEDLPLFSLKTFQESFQANSKETTGQIKRELQFCFMSSESWRDWVTKQRRAHSRRLKLARRIKEKESSFLVSEMNSNKAELISSMDSLSQMNQISLQHGQHREDKDSTGMNHQELQWATTSVRDYKDSGLLKERSPRKDGRPRIDSIPIQVFNQQGYQGKLNPRWVEMLMGLPIGWTMPSCTNPVTIGQMNLECLEMELYPTQHQEHLEFFGETWRTPTTLDSREHSISKQYVDISNGQSRKGNGLARQAIEQFNETFKKSSILDFQKKNPQAKKLIEKFDHCLIGHNGKQFVYCASQIIEKLKKETKELIKQGILEKIDYTSLDDSAFIYAIEDFEYNYENAKGEYFPVYIDDYNKEFLK